jgi:hypothetical protein
MQPSAIGCAKQRRAKEEHNMAPENDHWLTLGVISSGDLAKPNNNCDPQTAAALATILFGCYRASEANDPETFIAAAAAMLARYPTEIVIAVTDPVCGLASTNKWLPSIAEVREACEQAMAPRYVEERRQNERAHTERVIARVGKAPIGSPEHMRVLRSFKDLRAAMEAKPDPQGSKPFSLPVAEEKPLFGARPPVNTPDMAAYLARMREAAGGEEVSGP